MKRLRLGRPPGGRRKQTSRRPGPRAPPGSATIHSASRAPAPVGADALATPRPEGRGSPSNLERAKRRRAAPESTGFDALAPLRRYSARAEGGLDGALRPKHRQSTGFNTLVRFDDMSQPAPPAKSAASSADRGAPGVGGVDVQPVPRRRIARRAAIGRRWRRLPAVATTAIGAALRRSRSTSAATLRVQLKSASLAPAKVWCPSPRRRTPLSTDYWPCRGVDV